MDGVFAWVAAHGYGALFLLMALGVVGLYIAGVRHFTAVVAGMSKLEFPTFMAYAWTGGALWVATFLTLGYYLGENWRPIAELVHSYIHYASAVLIAVAIVGYFVWK